MMQDLTAKNLPKKFLLAIPFQLLLTAGLALRNQAMILISFIPLLIYGFVNLLINPLLILWISMFSNLTSITIGNVALYVAFFAFLIPSFLLVKCLSKDEGLYFDSFDLLFVPLGLLLLISFPQWNSMSKGFLGFFFLFLVPYFEVLILRSYFDEKNFNYSLLVFIAMSLVFNLEVLAAVLKVFSQGGYSVVALHSIGIGWAYSNYIAALANLFIPLNLAVFLTTRSKVRYIVLFNLIALFFSMLITISRGGFLTFLLSIITFGVSLAIAEGKLKYVAGIFFVIGGILLIIFKTIFGQLLLFRFAFTVVSNASIQNRFRMWAQAVEIIKKNPLIGSGPYQKQVFSGVLLTENPHNYYLKIGMDAGVIGIILFVAILILLLRRSIRLLHAGERRMRILGVAFLTTIVVASFNAGIEPTLSGFHYNPIFWFIAGLLLSLTSRKELAK